jgi:hypothetical protein
MNERLKIGIILYDYNIPKWQFKTLEKLSISEFAEIKLLLKINRETSFSNNSRSSFVYKMHEKIDRFIFRNKFDYDNLINIFNICNEVEAITLDIRHKNKVNYISEDLYDKIQGFNLDIVLNLECIELIGDLFKLSKYGIWTYEIGDRRITKEFSAGYWAFINKHPEMSANLKMSYKNLNKEIVLYRTSSSLYPNSLQVNLNRLYGMASLIIPRIVKGLFLFGDAFLEKTIKRFNYSIEISSGKTLKSPSSLSALLNFFYVVFRFTFWRIFYLKRRDWVLYFKIGDKKKLFSINFSCFHKIIPPKDRFWADPFVISNNNKNYIFVEELLYKKNKGRISVLELDLKGRIKSNKCVIEKPYHLSYPFIFIMDNSLYMVPESSGNNDIELYKCLYFPFNWSFVKVLMKDIYAVDTSLFFYNNKWWLFTSIDELNNNLFDNELFLFWADDLFSNDWKSHPDNPIVSDPKLARSAGRVFIYENKIYRPSQDCSGRYGKAINLNQITILTETDYEETLISKVEPSWDNKLKGCHTFNFDNNIIVIDAYSLRKRISFR